MRSLLREVFAQLLKRKPAAAKRNDLASALALHGSGDHAAAEAACRALLEYSPDSHDALHILGVTLLAQQRHDEAAAVLARVAVVQPASFEAHYNLASAHKAAGAPERALAAYTRAIELAHWRAEARIGAALALKDLGRYREAALTLREVIAGNPDIAEAHYNLALVLVSLQRFAEALASYRESLRCDPGFLLARSNLLFLLNAHSTDPEEILRQHRAWGVRHADVLEPLPLAADTADPARRLRIAYVSPDYWNHPVARFIEPVLRHHDRGRVEVWCYYVHDHVDGVTERLRTFADRWIDCAKLDDEALARRLRDDRIDIAVDLAGHTQRNRLLALARRPAPVTVTYLGYPTTSGIAAIDYRITDRRVDPPTEGSRNVETPAHLPDSYYCYGEFDEVPEPGPLPAKQSGTVTFGCFNAATKWSDESLRLWASVLSVVDGSRLLLKAKELSQPEIAARVLERFEALGIARERLMLKGWEATRSEHFAVYDAVDVALDAYPYNGATTTCEALWMGVPVVTLEGPTHASRMGASVLTAAGYPQWIANTPARFVEICSNLAADAGELARTRAGLRSRVRASPLMDAQRFTASLEDVYREMWRAWCSRASSA